LLAINRLSGIFHHYRYATREQARAAIFEYIAVFYNRIRIHSANVYLSPDEFEVQHAKNDSNLPALKNVALSIRDYFNLEMH
jgi:hypothetical protein